MAAINFPAASESPWYNPSNGITYEYVGGTWRAVNALSNSFDDEYVEVSGDNMTGNLTLGTDKITLNASNGSAEFAGSGTFGGSTVVYRDGEGKAGLSVYNGTIGGAGNKREFYVDSSGLIAAGGVGGAGITPGNFDTTARIVLDGSDGSAEFSSDVTVYGTSDLVFKTSPTSGVDPTTYSRSGISHNASLGSGSQKTLFTIDTKNTSASVVGPTLSFKSDGATTPEVSLNLM